MRLGRFGRSVGMLLAACTMLTILPAEAAVKNLPRHTAQARGEAERAMQEITEQVEREHAQMVSQEERISSVLLHWQPYPAAVRYAVQLTESMPDGTMRVRETMDRVYTTGLHLPLAGYGTVDHLYWSVRPLSYDGTPLADWSEPRPVRGEKADPAAPVLTTEYADMPYAPLYPVYAWIPLAGQMVHEVEVYRREGAHDRYLHTLRAGEYDVYDDMPFTVPGH